ncbi:hypothetical protein KBD08_02365 [Candidatus Babeliales bacterium]|nr:hypothetical protein [Candidatus Babeliales bacterium]
MIHLLLSILLITPCLHATQTPYVINTDTLPPAQPAPRDIQLRIQAHEQARQRTLENRASFNFPDAQTLHETHISLHNEPGSPLSFRFLYAFANMPFSRSNFDQNFNTAVARFSRRFQNLGNDTDKIRTTLLHLAQQH